MDTRFAGPPSEAARRRPRSRFGAIKLRSVDELDARTAVSKRAKKLIAGIANDLGGVENLSHMSQELIQRAAILGAFIEDHETRWLAGEKIPLEDYLASVNTQKRVLCALGLERRSRELNPRPLAQYLKDLEAEPEDETDE